MTEIAKTNIVIPKILLERKRLTIPLVISKFEYQNVKKSSFFLFLIFSIFFLYTSITIDAKKNDPGKICRPQSPLKEPKYQFKNRVDDWNGIFISVWEKTIVDYEYDES